MYTLGSMYGATAGIHHLCHEIALAGLGETDVAEYLAAESVAAALLEGLARLIHRHTEGNPLFMVAALEHMRETETHYCGRR